MPPYIYEEDSNQYRDTEDDSYVPEAVLLGLLAASIEAGQEAVTGIATGGLTANLLRRRLAEEIKTEYIRQFLLGFGGRARMRPGDWGVIGSLLKNQYKYLNGFMEEVAAGSLSEAQIAARARLYIASARQAYERAQARALGIKLPAYPGDGSTECGTNCKCHWRLEKIIEDAVLVRVDAYWELSAVEHCETCEVRGTEWYPYVIE